MKTNLDKRIETIECKLWNLQAKLLNSGLFFDKDDAMKAINQAGTALYKYRQSRYVKKGAN